MAAVVRQGGDVPFECAGAYARAGRRNCFLLHSGEFFCFGIFLRGCTRT